MAKKSLIEREKKRQKLNSKFFLIRKNLKKKLKKVFFFEEKLNFYKQLQKLPKNSSPTRLKNRCHFTGRGKGFYRDFGLSRLVFRELALNCYLPGVTKASW